MTGRRITDADVAAVVAAARDGRDGADAWPDTPDVPGAADPDPLPVAVLPPVLRDHVESVARATQTPPCMGALLAIAAVSAALRGRADVYVDDRGWTERGCIYVDVILPSGARKSPCYRAITDPLVAWEREAVEQIGPDRARALDRVAARRREHDAAIRAWAGGQCTADEVEHARLALADAAGMVPPVPRVIMSDATPEALTREMAAQGGAIAVLAPEGDPLRIADGRYARDGGARTGELLRAWTGEAIRIDRVSRETVHVERPALTLAITMQPGVLESLAHARTMRGEGVWARMLWLRPDAGLGRRATGRSVPRLDDGAAARYGRMLRRILGDPTPVGEIHVMGLTDDALDVVYTAEADQEAALRAGHDDGIPDWTAKSCGQAIRIACMLAIAARADAGGDLWRAPIDASEMAAAWEVVRALRTHAVAVLGGPAASPHVGDLAYVLRRARDLPPRSSLRELHDVTRDGRGLVTMDDLRPLVAELVDRGCMRLADRRAGRPGRPASPVVELHPSLRPDTHPKPTKPAKPAAAQDSAGFAGRSPSMSDDDYWHDLVAHEGGP